MVACGVVDLQGLHNNRTKTKYKICGMKSNYLVGTRSPEKDNP